MSATKESVEKLDLEIREAELKNCLERTKLDPDWQKFELEKAKTLFNLERIESARRNIEVMIRLAASEKLNKIEISEQVKANLKVMELINK